MKGWWWCVGFTRNLVTRVMDTDRSVLREEKRFNNKIDWSELGD